MMLNVRYSFISWIAVKNTMKHRLEEILLDVLVRHECMHTVRIPYTALGDREPKGLT